MNNYFSHIIILFAFFLGYTGSAQVIRLTTQTEVDSFDQSITEITGYLLIKTASGTFDEITNVNALSNVTSIEQYLRIEGNNRLCQIDGLSNLTSIGGSLSIVFNDTLKQIDGLSNLTSIGYSLRIQDNIALIQIDGLSNVTSIGDFIWIGNNDVLTQLNGLSSLTSTVSTLRIINNDLLSQVNGLSNLTSIGGFLWVGRNNSLIQIDGLSNLTSIKGNLDIIENTALTNCCGIQHLLLNPTGIDGSITISDNPSECNSQAEVLAASCMSATSNLAGLNQNLFESFPNPTSGDLQIDLNKTYQDIQVDLHSILGQQINRQDFTSTDQLNITMDVATGVYFIVVTVDEGYQEVLRVMKE